MFLIIACLAFADDADAIPKNVLDFKAACDARKAEHIERLESEVAEARKRMNKATSESDRKKLSASLKAAKEMLDEAKASAWHSHAPKINRDEDGSIGEFYTDAPNHMRVVVRFRIAKVENDKIVGAIIKDGAVPKLIVRKGGNVVRDVYSAPGESSETPATIIGEIPGWKEKKTEVLRGPFQVVSSEPLVIEPFDISKWDALLTTKRDKPKAERPASSDDDRAVTLLKQAEMLMTKNPSSARKRLQEIIDKYPDTPAAQEAQGLLEKLGK